VGVHRGEDPDYVGWSAAVPGDGIGSATAFAGRCWSGSFIPEFLTSSEVDHDRPALGRCEQDTASAGSDLGTRGALAPAHVLSAFR
jgi:hypothetical protein